MDDQSGSDLLQRWQDKEKCWHFEGSTRNLDRVVNVLGYFEDQFGTATENFLRDNPGAQLAIVEWIAEWLDHNNDWKDSFRAEICDACMCTVPPDHTCPECGLEGESL